MTRFKRISTHPLSCAILILSSSPLTPVFGSSGFSRVSHGVETEVPVRTVMRWHFRRYVGTSYIGGLIAGCLSQKKADCPKSPVTRGNSTLVKYCGASAEVELAK